MPKEKSRSTQSSRPAPQPAPQVVVQQPAPQKSNTGCWIAGVIGGCCCLLVVVIFLLLLFFGITRCSTGPFNNFPTYQGMEVPPNTNIPY